MAASCEAAAGPPTRSQPRAASSLARWTYRAVVAGWMCPSILPTIGKPTPLDRAMLEFDGARRAMGELAFARLRVRRSPPRFRYCDRVSSFRWQAHRHGCAPYVCRLDPAAGARRRIGRGAPISATLRQRGRAATPPARTLPQPVSPWRIELGVSGSSLPPGVQQFFIRLPIRSNGPEASPSAAGGRD